MADPLQDILNEKVRITKILQDSLQLPSASYHRHADYPFLPAVAASEIFENAQTYVQIDEIFSAVEQFVELNSTTVEPDTFTLSAGNNTNIAATKKKYDEKKVGKWISFYSPPVREEEEEEAPAGAFRPSLYTNQSSSSSAAERSEISFPTLKKMKEILATEKLIVSVLSLSGYNFSSEFTLIYGGKFTSKRVYENTLAIIRKALKAVDNSLPSEIELQQATFLLDQILWEFESKSQLFHQYLQHQFPLIDKITYVKNIDMTHAHVFIGKDESCGHTIAHVRFEDDLILLDSKKKTPEADNLIKFISYHSISLIPDKVSDFSVKKDKVLRKQEQLSAKKRGTRSKTVDAILLEFLQGSLSRSTYYLVNSSLLVNLGEDGAILNDIGVASGAQGNGSTDFMVLDAKAPKTFVSEASFCSEVLVWGHDSYFSMGLGEARKTRRVVRSEESVENGGSEEKSSDTIVDELYDPRPLSLSRNITIERVKMIACSARHTLLLTHYGSLYSTGDNTEGALGLVDTATRQSFTLIDYFAAAPNKRKDKVADRAKLVFIAAGAGSLGCHSMAIDINGHLYSWGFPKATGTGSIQPVNSPTKITIPKSSPSTSDGEGAEDSRSEEKIRMVCCGDGFTVCLTTSGLVFTWGQWSHGRLGLGAIPSLQNARRSRSADQQGNQKLAKYQMKPARVLGLEEVIQIACGESHVLALLADNSMVAWGQNALGQVGVGPTRSGLLKDAFSPVLIAPFFPSRRKQAKSLLMKESNVVYFDYLHGPSITTFNPVKNIYCGAFHSLCIDTNGNCWSWGSRGSPCLAHSDTVLLGEWSNKISALFSLSTTDSEKMVPFELLGWCMTWSMPRKISSLEGSDIVHISAGDLHSIFLAADGRIFLAGSGPSVPPFSPPNRITDDVDDEVDTKKENAESKRASTDAKVISKQSVINDVVSSPRCPSASWLQTLCTRNVHYIASAGCRVYVIIDEELISNRLTNILYRKLLSNGRGMNEDDELDEGEDNDLMTVDSRFSDFTSSQFSSILESRGKADCMVIASGHIFLCHKALLALRSPELRNMIIMEAPIEIEGSADGSSSSTALIQILLPELNRDAARALFFYLYRDALPFWAIGSLATLTALSRVGKTLRIPRLFLLCERYIDILTASNVLHPGEAGPTRADEFLSYSSEQLVEEMPPPTLVRDLGSLLGDPEFADVRFIAESRAVAAHRFILEGRCEYFRAMFRSGMAEGSFAGRNVIDVVVPDSFVGFLRLLIFIYTDTLPDGSDGALLEDLMAADRYGITEMKELVQNMLKPSLFNWIDLLRAAELLSLPKLKTTVLCFLRDNFHVLQLEKLSQQLDFDREKPYQGNSMEDRHKQHQILFQQLREEFPNLLEDIIILRSFYAPVAPSTLLIEEGKLTKESSFADEDKHPFPFWALALAAVSIVVYSYATQILPMGPIVPVINIGGFLFLMIYGFRILSR